MPQPFQLGNQGNADLGLNTVMGPLQPYAQALPGQVIPGYQAYSANIQNNPFAPQQIQGAQAGAALGPQVAGMEMGGAQNLAQGAGQIMQTGFDPQQALYNQQQNLTAQQGAAADAASGVSGPAAAGTIDQSLQNFNIGWQNNQLGREQSSLQSAGAGFGQAGALGGQAIQTDAAASSLPYMAYLSQQQNDIGALGAQVSGTNAAFGPDMSLANLEQSYLNLGQTGTGLAQAGQAQQFGQNQALGSELGQSLGALTNGTNTTTTSPSGATTSTSSGGGLGSLFSSLFGGGGAGGAGAGGSLDSLSTMYATG